MKERVETAVKLNAGYAGPVPQNGCALLDGGIGRRKLRRKPCHC